MKKSLLFLMLNFIIFNTLALDVPNKSMLDERIQYLNYNANNITLINAKVGYVSAINFSKDETVKNVAIGFNLGWEIVDSGNTIYLKPVSYQGGSGSAPAVEPVPADWKTNLLVETNKRFYVFELQLLDDTQENNAFFVNFKYPQDEKDEKEKSRQLAFEQANKEKIEKQIDQGLSYNYNTKNYDYFMQIGDLADEITPDFAFDDGVRTYFGFSSIKKIPAIFGYEGEVETMTNTSVKNTKKFAIIVVHNVYKKLILRSGEQVVGIINKGFGVVKPNNNTTINSSILRIKK